MVKVSIVIPVKNGAGTIARCLTGIFRQTLQPFEVIVIDSGSTDGTIDVLREFSEVRVVSIAPEEFNHGATRNLGASLSSGEFTLFTVQDAWPKDQDWIATLVDCLTTSSAAGVCGTQVVPHEQCFNPVEWWFPQSVGENQIFSVPSAQAFDALSPSEKQNLCGWDNVNAMYRSEILKSRIPFRRTTFAEDAAWAVDALRAGYRIAYCPSAPVYHCHIEAYQYHVTRTIAVAYHRYALFGSVPQESSVFVDALRAAKILLRRPVTWPQKMAWWWYNLRTSLGIRQAVRDVRKSLQQGEANLSALYQRVCGEIPQAGSNSGRS